MPERTPCPPDCADRTSDCHAACERYLVWRLLKDLDAAYVHSKRTTEQDTFGLVQERKERLRRRGY